MLTELFVWASDIVHKNLSLTSGNGAFLGLGTVVLGFVGYLARKIPYDIYFTIKRWSSSEFSITTRNEDYEAIVDQLFKCRTKFFSRNYSLGQSSAHLTPGYGRSFGFYKHRLVSFSRSIMEGKNYIEEKVDVIFFTRKKSIIESFIKEATGFDISGSLKIYVSSGEYWMKSSVRPKRALSSIYMNDNIKETLVADLEKFQKSEKLYVNNGIPYKRCYLLYGPPGCGKTSLIFALASVTGKNIRYITGINNDINSLLEQVTQNDLVVFEDIDTLATLKRSDDLDTPDPKEKRVLHMMLNTLDGFRTPHGMIVVITSNKPEALDDALLRKGRIDCMYYVGFLDKAQTKKKFEAFFGVGSSAAIDHLLQDYSGLPGAVLQDLFFNKSIDEAIKGLEKEILDVRRTETGHSLRGDQEGLSDAQGFQERKTGTFN